MFVPHNRITRQVQVSTAAHFLEHWTFAEYSKLLQREPENLLALQNQADHYWAQTTEGDEAETDSSEHYPWDWIEADEEERINADKLWRWNHPDDSNYGPGSSRGRS